MESISQHPKTSALPERRSWRDWLHGSLTHGEHKASMNVDPSATCFTASSPDGTGNAGGCMPWSRWWQGSTLLQRLRAACSVSEQKGEQAPSSDAVVVDAARTSTEEPSGGSGADASSHFDCDVYYLAEIEPFLGRKLGHGAHGVVYEGKWRGKQVAVKVLNLKSDDACRPVCRELQLCAAFRHSDRVVKLLGASRLEQKRCCLIMELMEGGSLEERIYTETKPRLQYEEILQIGLDIAEGLKYLHPKVIHRDIKAQNVLLDKQGRCKIADFGISRLKDPSCTHLEVTDAVGTVMYMAPEAFHDGTRATEKADAYSLGCVLAECLSCTRPFEGFTTGQIIHAVTAQAQRPIMPSTCPRPLFDIIMRCWHADPHARPSAAELVRSFQMLIVSGGLCSTSNAAYEAGVLLQHELGKGARCTVHKATWRGQQVAVKVPTADNVENFTEITVERELKLSAAFRQSTCMVQLLGASRRQPECCLIMEMMEGGTLSERIHNPNKPPMELLEVGRDIAEGLACLHPAVVHRNLRPQTVLLSSEGRAKIGGFGLCSYVGDVSKEELLTYVREHGTTCYTAPEVTEDIDGTAVPSIFRWREEALRKVKGQVPEDRWRKVALREEALRKAGQGPEDRCDVHSLGCILYECWTRTSLLHMDRRKFCEVLPQDMLSFFTAFSAHRRGSAQLGNLASLVLDCWSCSPHDRPAVTEVLHRIDEYIELARLPVSVSCNSSPSSYSGSPHASAATAGTANRSTRTPPAGIASQTVAEDEVTNPESAGVMPCAGRRALLMPVPTSRFYVDFAEVEPLGPMLGKGASGIVYKATWRGQEVAVKVLEVPTPNDYHSIAREVELHRAFRHSDCVVKLLGASKLEHHRCCLIMELVEGGNLSQRIHKTMRRLKYKKILHIGRDIAEGLAYLHPTVIHRDLKPQNVLLNKQGHAKIADFGISRLKDPEHTHLSVTRASGTAMYMAPELLSEDGTNLKITEKCDIYSMGCILYECCTRSPPSPCNDWQIRMQCAWDVAFQRDFSGETGPHPLTDIISRCWIKDPQARPSAAQLRAMLEGLIEEAAPRRTPANSQPMVQPQDQGQGM